MWERRNNYRALSQGHIKKIFDSELETAARWYSLPNISFEAFQLNYARCAMSMPVSQALLESLPCCLNERRELIEFDNDNQRIFDQIIYKVIKGSWNNALYWTPIERVALLNQLLKDDPLLTPAENNQNKRTFEQAQLNMPMQGLFSVPPFITNYRKAFDTYKDATKAFFTVLPACLDNSGNLVVYNYSREQFLFDSILFKAVGGVGNLNRKLKADERLILFQYMLLKKLVVEHDGGRFAEHLRDQNSLFYRCAAAIRNFVYWTSANPTQLGLASEIITVNSLLTVSTAQTKFKEICGKFYEELPYMPLLLLDNDIKMLTTLVMNLTANIESAEEVQQLAKLARLPC